MSDIFGVNGSGTNINGESGSEADRKTVYMDVSSPPDTTNFTGVLTLNGLPIGGGGGGSAYELIFAVTNQISNIISTGQKFQIRAPRDFTISKFKLSLNTTAGPNFSVTIRKNGNIVSSVFLNSLVQNTAITDSFLENDIISVDVSNVGTGTASGLICYLLE